MCRIPETRIAEAAVRTSFNRFICNAQNSGLSRPPVGRRRQSAASREQSHYRHCHGLHVHDGHDRHSVAEEFSADPLGPSLAQVIVAKLKFLRSQSEFFQLLQ